MSSLGTAVLLQQTGAGQDYSFFMMMGAIFLIFYFLLIRPQQRRQKEHEEKLKGIVKGDSVVTSGGLHGKVVGVADEVLTVEIAALKSGDRVRVKVQRGRVDAVTKGDDKGDAKSGDKS